MINRVLLIVFLISLCTSLYPEDDGRKCPIESVDKNVLKKYGSLRSQFKSNNADGFKRIIEENPDVFSNKVVLSYFLSEMIENGNYPMAEWIVLKNIDVIDFPGSLYGQTPLINSIMTDKQKMFEWLINNKCNINATDAMNISPIEAAVQYRRADMFNYLLSCGAKPSRPDSNHYNILEMAVNNSSPQMVSAILSRLNLFSLNQNDLESALYLAVLKNEKTIILRLISAGADLNGLDKSGENLLFSLLYSDKNLELLDFLYRNGSNIKCLGRSSQSLLHAATRYGSYEICKFLIEKGLSVNQRDQFGDTPLHLAEKIDCKRIYSLLLINKSDPNITNSRGQKPSDVKKFKLLRSDFISEQGFFKK